MQRKPNEVGAIWRKENDKGEYLSISLDVKALLELAGGSIELVNISAYPNENANPKAPDYHMKYYPKGGTARPPRQAPPPDDDGIPF